MLYADPKQEAESLMLWLTHRLEHATVHSFPNYVKSFKIQWRESFGELEVPQEFKDMVSAKYESLR